MMGSLFRSAPLLIGALALTVGLSRAAGAINVSPTRLQLNARSTYTSFTVTNPGDAPLVFQVEARAWSQKNNKDVYTPTQDLIVAPPVLSVAAKSGRVVRIALRDVRAGDRETTYRVIVTQVPDATKVAGVRFIYQVNLPLFVAPDAAPVWKLNWSARIDRRKRLLTVSIANVGNTHLTVDDIKAFGGFAGNVPLGSVRQPSDVLAGATRAYEVPLQAMPQGEAVTVEVTAIDQTPVRAVIALSS